MMDMVDMVELMADMEEELVWKLGEDDAKIKLNEDEGRFSETLDRLFKAQLGLGFRLGLGLGFSETLDRLFKAQPYP